MYNDIIVLKLIRKDSMEPQTPPVQPPQPEPTPQPLQQTPPSQSEPTAPVQTPANPTPVATPGQPSTPQATGEDPGKTMAIIALVLAFLMPLIGLILAIVAKKKSKKSGHSNGFAIAAIAFGAINLIISTAFFAAIFFATFSGVQQAARCQEYGVGTHSVDGKTLTCTFEDVN